MAVHAVMFGLVICCCCLISGAHSAEVAAGGNNHKRCFICTSTEEGSPCERDPTAAGADGVLDGCRRDACTIVRVEEWPSRRVKSFYRGCDAKIGVFQQENHHCIVHSNERTCFTACADDLCNGGDGLNADREFLRYDNVMAAGPPTTAASAAHSSHNKKVFSSVSAILMTFPLWAM